jgi:hypothetical protein
MVDGKRHGEGTYTDANGAKYVGRWVGDKNFLKKHGEGVHYDLQGRCGIRWQLGG